jgi:hypothetical protein
MTDPRTAALAEALKGTPMCGMTMRRIGRPNDVAWERDAAAILAALPPDWCGHGLARELDLVQRLAAAEYQRDAALAEIAGYRAIEEAARAHIAWEYLMRGAPRFTLSMLRAALEAKRREH